MCVSLPLAMVICVLQNLLLFYPSLVSTNPRSSYGGPMQCYFMPLESECLGENTVYRYGLLATATYRRHWQIGHGRKEEYD